MQKVYVRYTPKLAYISGSLGSKLLFIKPDAGPLYFVIKLLLFIPVLLKNLFLAIEKELSLKLFDNYSPRLVVVTFVSSFIYLFVFFLSRYFEHPWIVVLINIAYAFFVLGTVIMERMRKISGEHNTKLLTLGTTVSAIAVSMLDAIFTLADHPIGGNSTLIIYFVIVTLLIFSFILLFARLIPVK